MYLAFETLLYHIVLFAQPGLRLSHLCAFHLELQISMQSGGDDYCNRRRILPINSPASSIVESPHIEIPSSTLVEPKSASIWGPKRHSLLAGCTSNANLVTAQMFLIRQGFTPCFRHERNHDQAHDVDEG